MLAEVMRQKEEVTYLDTQAIVLPNQQCRNQDLEM
jgi:hypothetical protein